MTMRFTYTGIEVRDLDQSIAFYRDVLGMEYAGRGKIEATGGEVAAFKAKGSEHVLEMNWYPDTKYHEGSELDHLAFEPQPDVAPLLDVLDEHERYAVAVVDKAKARLFTVFLAFECDNVEREVQRLLKAGATLARAVEVRPRYVVGFVKDPNGIWLELYEERKK